MSNYDAIAAMDVGLNIYINVVYVEFAAIRYSIRLKSERGKWSGSIFKRFFLLLFINDFYRLRCGRGESE